MARESWTFECGRMRQKGITDMESQRRYLSWSLAIIAAISLIFAGVRGAQAGLVALKALSVFDLPEFVTEMSDTLILAGFALLAGTCAILVAPHRVLVAYKIIASRRKKGRWIRETRPGIPFAQLERIDSNVPTEKPAPPPPLTSAARGRMKRPA